MGKRVAIDAVRGGFAIHAIDYLGEAFQSYRDACSGARYEPKTRASVVGDTSVLIGILSRLSQAGFVPVLDDAARNAVTAGVNAINARVDAVDKRMDAMDLALRQKGLFLYGFQRTGARWLASRGSALLADQMGLGKTVEALASLPEATEVGVIVICPATLKRNWLDEIQRWRPDYRVTVLSGKGSFRWPACGEIVVINYDVLPMAAMIAPLGSKFSEPKFACVKVIGGEKIKVEDDTLSKAFPRDYPVRLVLDEAHFAKSGKAQRTVACRAISALCTATLVMTATPLLSRPQELYSVLQLGNLAQEAFGNFETFKRLFGGVHEQVSQFKSVLVWKGVTDAQEVGQRLSRVMLRRLRAEVLPDLPTKTYREIKVDLAPRANKLADKVVRELAEEGLDVMAVQDIAELPFERFSEVRSALAAAKTEALVELIESYEEEEEPVIVFCAHHAPLDELGKRPGWGVIHGGTPQELRQDLVKAFQVGQLKGLACGIKAAGVGITLTRAAHAVFVDRAWTPADNDQAEDRICRIGQTRGCVITRLVAAHGLDKHIAFLIEAKMRLNEASVEQGRAIEKEILAASVDVDALIAAADAENARIEEEARVQRIHAEGGRILPNGVVLRRPRTPIETWAGNGLGILLGRSGFTPATVRTGCELARQIVENNGLLTDQQWQTAVQICRVHHQQLPFGM